MAGDRVGWLDGHHLTASGALSTLPDLDPALTRLVGLPADGVTGTP